MAARAGELLVHHGIDELSPADSPPRIAIRKVIAHPRIQQLQSAAVGGGVEEELVRQIRAEGIALDVQTKAADLESILQVIGAVVVVGRVANLQLQAGIQREVS